MDPPFPLPRALQSLNQLVLDSDNRVLCSLEGDWQEAMRVRTRMERAGIAMTLHVYNALIAACERAQQPALAMELYQSMQRNGIRPNYGTLTPLAVSNPWPPQPSAAAAMMSGIMHSGSRTCLSFIVAISVMSTCA